MNIANTHIHKWVFNLIFFRLNNCYTIDFPLNFEDTFLKDFNITFLHSYGPLKIKRFCRKTILSSLLDFFDSSSFNLIRRNSYWKSDFKTKISEKTFLRVFLLYKKSETLIEHISNKHLLTASCQKMKKKQFSMFLFNYLLFFHFFAC